MIEEIPSGVSMTTDYTPLPKENRALPTCFKWTSSVGTTVPVGVHTFTVMGCGDATLITAAACFGGYCFASTCVYCVKAAYHTYDLDQFKEDETPIPPRTIRHIFRYNAHDNVKKYLGEDRFKTLMWRQGGEFLQVFQEEIKWRSDKPWHSNNSGDSDYDIPKIALFYTSHGAQLPGKNSDETLFEFLQDAVCRRDEQYENVNYKMLSEEHKLQYIRETSTEFADFMSKQKITHLGLQEVLTFYNNFYDGAAKPLLAIPSLDDESKLRLLREIPSENFKKVYRKNHKHLHEILLDEWLSDPETAPTNNVLFLINKETPYDETKYQTFLTAQNLHIRKEAS